MTRMIKVMWEHRRTDQIYRMEKIGGGTRKVIPVELILKPTIMRNHLENILEYKCTPEREIEKDASRQGDSIPEEGHSLGRYFRKIRKK